MKILACSDIHIGRIPAVPGKSGLSGHEAWDAIVEKAIGLQVDVLVLAGDVVERDNSWFEAHGPLVKGLQKLGEHDIKVVAVAGNHDATIFPILAKECGEVRMLGLDGKWEHCDIDGVRFVGRSFAANTCTENPLDTFDRTLCDYLGPVLGLLHCDADGPIGGRYASVPTSQIADLPVPLWVMGHIHGSKTLAGGKAFYCGSPFALDSSETGGHGIWLLETEGERSWKEPKFVPLSPWLFCECPVDLTGIEESTQLIAAITRSMRSLPVPEGPWEDVCCHLAFTGTLPVSIRLDKELPSDKLVELEVAHQNPEITVHALDTYADETVPPVDLRALAKGSGPEALLAHLLLDPGSDPDLLEKVGSLQEESFSAPAFRGLQTDDSDDPKALVRDAGMALLRALMSQKEEM